MTKDKKLNAKDKLFCKNYTSKETYMNGVRSYMATYPSVSYNTAKVNASKLLTNANIIEYIELLIDEAGINENMLDYELKKVIVQDIEKGPKLQAIKHANDLLIRIEKAKQKALDDKKISTDVINPINKQLLDSLIDS